MIIFHIPLAYKNKVFLQNSAVHVNQNPPYWLKILGLFDSGKSWGFILWKHIFNWPMVKKKDLMVLNKPYTHLKGWNRPCIFDAFAITATSNNCPRKNNSCKHHCAKIVQESPIGTCRAVNSRQVWGQNWAGGGPWGPLCFLYWKNRYKQRIVKYLKVCES